MKKLFFLLLLAAALVPNDARACIGISTHNYYLFDILDGSFSKERRITERCNQFWQNYTKNEVNDYLWNKENVMEIAKKLTREDLHKSLSSYAKDFAINMDESDEEQAKRLTSRFQEIFKDSIGDIKPLAPKVTLKQEEEFIESLPKVKI